MANNNDETPTDPTTERPDNSAEQAISTEVSEADEAKLEEIPDGSGTDAKDGDDEQDDASGGSPQEPESNPS